MTRTNRKGELFDHLEECDVLRDSATSTLLNGAVSAGDNSITVDDDAGIADGDWLRVGTEEDAELCQVDGTPAANVIAIRSPLHRAHADNDAVVLQTVTNLGHITDDGARFGMSGDDNAINVVTRRLALGYSIGHVEQFMEFSLAGMNVDNFATAVGIPESAITGTGVASDPHRIVLDPEQFRAENNLSFQFRGVRHDGVNILVQLWIAELDFTALNVALSRGQVAPLPLRARATSAVAVHTYS